MLAELLPANAFYARKYNQAGITFDVETLTNDAATWDKKYDEQLRGVKKIKS